MGNGHAEVRRGGFAALGVALLGAAVWAATAHVTVGDTYCGTAFYDSTRSGACGTHLRTMGGLAALFSVLGLSALVVAIVAGAPRRAKVRQVPILLAGFVALALALVGLNRVLEPTHSRFCGSVVNRHRTYDAAIERQCDAALRPHVRAAQVAFAGAAGSAALAAVLLVRQRRQLLPAAGPS